MTVFRCTVLFLLASCLVFAQSDRGVLTGSVTDPAGAVVPNISVTIVNPATAVQAKTMTTDTGSYTFPNLSAGVYDLLVEAPGFARWEQKGIRIQVAQSVRVDAQLQLQGAQSTVIVTDETPLLTTESATVAHTVGRDILNSLPVNFAIGQGAVRNPLSFVQLSPGAFIRGWNDIKVNGAPLGTFKIVFEGQDGTSALDSRVTDEMQPSVEAIEEFTLQSSNYSAEFGSVGGGLFNFTSRSGTNEFHGSGYEYFANEFLNAGTPFTDNGRGELVRTRSRKNDFGGSIGGPLLLPRLYNGRNRTCFFFNLERYVNRETRYDGIGTVPTEAFRRGDFSSALTGRVLGTDGIGRPILENTIYDPTTARTISGRVYRDPFPNNVIPQSRLDPVAVKIQNLIPKPENAAVVNNFSRFSPFRKIQTIPSVKIDHSLSAQSKISGYWSMQATDKDNGTDGLPDPLSARRDQIIRSQTVRMNYDQTLTPKLLLHMGAGYQRYKNPDSSPLKNMEWDAAKEVGLKGQYGTGFPRITGLSAATGGMMDIGPTNRTWYFSDKVTAAASMSWVTGDHFFKWGGDYSLDGFTNRASGAVPGNFAFAAGQSGLPALQGVALPGGSVGLPYASFLLGMANTASVGNEQDPQYRKYTLALFAQDTWRIARKLTLNYGLRWDYQPAPHELWHRTSGFSPAVKNPSAGGLLGGTAYEGYGPGRCNCTFTETYPWAFGPRLGAAYSWDSKTVIRAGIGISYTQTAQFRYIGGGNSLGMGFNTLGFSSAAAGEPAMLLRDGLVYDRSLLNVASYDPGIRPQSGQTNSPPAWVDNNAGRPARMLSWNISIQREVSKDLSVEAAYVGNRGAWFRADGLNDFNGNTENRLKTFGLDIKNAAHRTLLTSRMDSAAVIAAGFKAPYTGFPMASTLAQALRPYPQFGGLTSLWAPLGNTWYDSLQVKVTRRPMYGLGLTAAYTWSKNLATVEDHAGATVPLNDVYNRRNLKTISANDQPHVLVVGFTYQTPRFGRNAFTRLVLSDWTFGGILRYASGYPIRIPAANNALGSILMRSTFANRVPGQPLFLKDLNSPIDPNRELVLNPKAWADPAPGEWGASAVYYSDYRYARRPDEQLSLGKLFKITERISFSFRAEFFNVFNRTYRNNPDSGNAQATPIYNSAGNLTAGFGRINPGSVFAPPRSGQFVARIQF